MTRRRLLCIFMISSLLGAGGVFILVRVLERDDAQRARSNANFGAIVASCELLNRKIVESQRPPDPKSSTAILIQSILANASPKVRAEFYRRLAIERESAPRLTEADCELEAKRAVEAALKAQREGT